MVHISRRIAERVSDELLIQKKSEHWLAEQTGIPRTTLRRSLKGNRSFPIEEVADIAHHLDIDAAALMNESVGLASTA